MVRNGGVRGGGDPDALEELLSGDGNDPRALALEIVTTGRRSGLEPSGSVVIDGERIDVDDLYDDPRIEAARIRRGPFTPFLKEENGNRT